MFGLSPVLEGVIAGLAISGANTVAGVIMAKRSASRPVKDAMSFILAGMAVRLLIMTILVWLCISVAGFHQLAFALSVMISFFLMLMTEGFFFHTSHERNKKPIVRRKRVRFPEADTAYDSPSATSKKLRDSDAPSTTQYPGERERE